MAVHIKGCTAPVQCPVPALIWSHWQITCIRTNYLAPGIYGYHLYFLDVICLLIWSMSPRPPFLYNWIMIPWELELNFFVSWNIQWNISRWYRTKSVSAKEKQLRQRTGLIMEYGVALLGLLHQTANWILCTKFNDRWAFSKTFMSADIYIAHGLKAI